MTRPEIIPYFNPAYWQSEDVHGVPCALPNRPELLTALSSLATLRHIPAVLSTMRQHALRREGYSRDQAYPNGQEVDVRNMPLASFVVHHEVLVWGARYRRPSAKEYTAFAPPVRPTYDQFHSLGDTPDGQSLRHGCFYASGAYSMSVGARRLGVTYPLLTPLQRADAVGSFASFIEATFHRPFTVGQASYLYDPMHQHSYYSRVSGLWLAGYKPPSQKKPPRRLFLFDLLGKKPLPGEAGA
jgi:hypothetical protein